MHTTFEIDPYAAIRSAMSPAHANLGSVDLVRTVGHVPAAVTLHQALSSPELRQALMSILLGGGRRSVQFGGADISIPDYLRMISRLCLDLAEQHENAPRNIAAEVVPFERETGKLGKGSSIRVTDTRVVPFRWICSIAVALRITRTSGGESKTGLKPMGTGVLISPCHVLTAAHLFRSRDDRGSVTEHQDATDVWVTMARDEDTKPFGEVQAKSWTVHPKWNPDAPVHQYDYGLITLSKPVGSGCFWGGAAKCGEGTVMGALPSGLAANLIAGQVMTAGYPDSRKNQMWCFKGTLSAGSAQLDASLKKQGAEEWFRKTGLITISADAERGQSGSPVWVLNDGKRHLVGILVEAGSEFNIAVAVNDSVIRQIQSWMSSSGCDSAAPALKTREGELSPEQEGPPPRGVLDFQHFFQPMKPDDHGLTWTSDGAEKKLDPVNPGFIDDKDNLQTRALQVGLADLLTGNPDFSRFLTKDSIRLRRGLSSDKIHVALVDLTGTKMTRPDFAGWASTVAVNAGSTIKVAPLYAAFQLKTDLEHTARSEGITNTQDLLATVDARWKRAGIAGRPDLGALFNGDQKPPDLAFANDVQDALNHVVFHEANVAASLLIRKIGFPYIASALWRSGLRHPKRGGIWLMWNFDENRPQQWDSAPEPSPGPVFPHTATALSLATFYTLIAQGRLPNAAYSGEMKRILVESWYPDVLPHAKITGKVGLDNKCLTWKVNDQKKRECATWTVLAAHEADYIENGTLRYAVAVMTKEIPEGIDVLKALIVELDNLIRRNNP